MKSTFPIAGRTVGTGQPCYVIAEAGVNHNCDVQLGYKLVETAAAAGADAIKFQSYTACKIATRVAPRYWVEPKDPNGTQWDTFAKLDKLSDRDFKSLLGHAKHVGHHRLLHALRRRSGRLPGRAGRARLQDRLRRPHLPRPHRARGARGQADDPLHGHRRPWPRSRRRSRSAARAGNDEVVLLHCTLKYPCPPEGINLRMMEHLMRAFPEVPVGLSDHSLGISVPQAAVALGRLHDREALHGRQDAARARPTITSPSIRRSCKAMVEGIRTVEKALGKAQKGLEPLEKEALPATRGAASPRATRDPRGHHHHPRHADLQAARHRHHAPHLDLVVGRVARRTSPRHHPHLGDGCESGLRVRRDRARPRRRRPRPLPEHQAPGRLPRSSPTPSTRRQEAPSVDRVVVSTDDERVAEVARALTAPRCPSCARTTSPRDLPSLKPVIVHAVSESEAGRRARRRGGDPAGDDALPRVRRHRGRDRRSCWRASFDTVVSVTEDRTLNWREPRTGCSCLSSSGRAAARSRSPSTARTARSSPCGAHVLDGDARFGERGRLRGPRQARRLHRSRPRGLLDGRAAAAPAPHALPRGRQPAHGHGPRLPLAGHRGRAARGARAPRSRS